MRAFIALTGISAVSALVAWRWSASNTPQPDLGLTASPSYAFVDGSAAGADGRVTFALENRGPRPVTLLRVERNCSCAEVADVKGRVIGPGQSWQLSARIGIPDAKFQAATLLVAHDGAGSPLRLTMEALGRRRLPYAVSDRFGQAAFFELDAPDASQTVSLVTVEPADREPWLGRMTCELPEVSSERARVTEKTAGSAVVRTYEYRIGWSKLPPQREFYAAVKVATNYGDKKEFEAGYVGGTLAASEPFSPRVARLTAAGGWSDTVAFRTWKGKGWAIRETWTAPDWLGLAWNEHAGKKVLRIALRSQAGNTPLGPVAVPLVDDEGRWAEIPVEVEKPGPP